MPEFETIEVSGKVADQLIAAEVAIQDKMWGDTNERADATHNQLIDAAMAQTVVSKALTENLPEEAAVEIAKAFYPTGWDGLRSYGSVVANLVVAAAFLRSEIKRRIAAGDSLVRTKRGEPYHVAQPYMTSEEAAAPGATLD